MFKWLNKYLQESEERRRLEIEEADVTQFEAGRRYVKFQMLMASLRVSSQLWARCAKQDTAFTRGMQMELEDLRIDDSLPKL